MNGMLRCGRLSEFVGETVTLYNEESREKSLWEVWLHRVFDKSYADFLRSVGELKDAEPTEEEVKDIVSESMEMLKSFRPE